MAKQTFQNNQKKISVSQVISDALNSVTEMPWFEVFHTGKHTDAQGNAKDWTQDDLEQIVTNFESDDAAFVTGHPSSDAPAYGWAKDIKLTEDGKLYVSGDNVNVNFAKSVFAGSYPKRSIGLRKKADGTWFMNHIAFLGAVKPALELAPVGEYKFTKEQAAQVTSYDFSIETTTANSLSRLMRSFRDWIIDKHGEDEANKIVDEWDIKWLERETIREEIKDEDERELVFSQETSEDDIVKLDNNQMDDLAGRIAKQMGGANFQQGNPTNDPAKPDGKDTEIAQLKAQIEQQNFSNSVATHQKWVNDQISAGKLLPAQAHGLADFMAHIALSADGEPTEFTFSQGEGKDVKEVKQKPVDFIKALFEQNTKNVIGDDINLDPTPVSASNSKELDEQISNYQKENKCSYNVAFDAVVSNEGA
jgi:hypothetical protein